MFTGRVDLIGRSLELHELRVEHIDFALEAGLPPNTDAYSVARACATGYQALADVANAIAAGDIACGIAGGTDSASDVPIALSKNLGAAFIEQRGARTLLARVKPFTRLGIGATASGWQFVRWRKRKGDVDGHTGVGIELEKV